ncbi:MAG: phenylacetate--CoA ligase family protein [Caldilineae bacterium]|nr:MAG: phenylacetate--CoA ligase family protein [Caldilineae bacterium]
MYRLGRLLWRGGIQTQRHLHTLERTQWLSAAELKNWQFEKLKEIVQYAYEYVPYYRRRYRQAGIHPQDIRTLDDFEQLPFLTKADINNHLPEMVSPHYAALQPESTGGSTGEPLRFFVDDSFWWWNAALEFRGRGWYGVREGDKMAWVWGAAQDMPSWSRGARLKARLMRHRFLNAFAMTRPKMQHFAEMLSRWQPVMFRAYPSALALFASYLEEMGITNIRPRLIETSAEKVTPIQRQLFQRVFQCAVADCYSARELGTIAYQCPQQGLHVCETRYLEIVAHGNVVPAGQLGEIAVTSLTQFGMPLIRYRIGDMGLYAPAPCSCGRGLPCLQEVVGRVSEFLVTAEGQFVHSTFLARIFRQRPAVVRFQVYQPDKEHLHIQLVLKEEVPAPWFEETRQALQEHFGSAMQISLQAVEDIPLTPAGKHRFVISEVSPPF